MSDATSSCVTNNPDHTCHRFFHGRYEDFAGTKLWEKAKEELNEIPEKREQDIQYIRNLVKSREPNLVCDLSDSFLLKFLRVRKFDPERAFKLICQYYKAHTNYPCIYQEYWPSSVAEILKTGVTTVLPQTDRKGRAIIIARLARWDTSKFKSDHMSRTVLLTIEAVLREERFQINGVVLILDWEGFILSHLAEFTPSYVYRSANSIQRWQPLRLKGVFSVHVSPVFNIAFGILSPFLTKKIRQRFHVLGGDLKELHEFIDEDVLPVDLGGTNSDYIKAEEEWCKYICSLEDVFRENYTKYGYNRATLDESGYRST